MHLLAVASLAWQVNGLVGRDGIVPAAARYREAWSSATDPGWLLILSEPTALWLAPADWALYAHLVLALIASAALFAGFAPWAALLTLVAVWVSLGQAMAPYRFRYKIDDPTAWPPVVAPDMPRLDWQMWFAALYGCERSEWFQGLLLALLDGSGPVADLLAEDPFHGEAPRYLRTPHALYTFTGPTASAFWDRRPLSRSLCPVLGRDQDGAPAWMNPQPGSR